ncbi:MAG: hypothetical protein OEW39_04055 [Deltaproteobacteria bacterium]|nr:hypothetical protein [Deltaproteobacteria bacterium]
MTGADSRVKQRIDSAVERFQVWLDTLNRRFGGVGALVTTVALVTLLFYALGVIMEEFFFQ